MSYCAYHPLTKAAQQCAHCQKDFCLLCSNELDESQQTRFSNAYYCFICDSEMTSLDEQSSVPPFWRNLTQIYRYPSSLAAIMVIIVTSALSAITSFSLFAIIPTIAIMHYCFACLRTSAAGNMQAPEFDKCFEGSISPFFYLIIIVFIGSAFIGGVTAILGNGFGIIAGLFCLLAIPASLITLCIEESLAAALNPAKLMQIVRVMGSSYFFAFLFMFMMFSSVGVVTYAIGYADSWVNRFLISAATNYYNIVIFHILGYLVFQNATQLGFNKSEQTLDKNVRDKHQRLNANIEILIKSGDYERAIELTSQQIKSGTATLLQWQRCLKLLLANGSDKNIEGFAERYFEKLETDQQTESIADDYIAIKRRVKKFEPKTFDRKLAIANSLLEIGRYKYVVLLLQNFMQSTKEKQQIAESIKLLAHSYAKLPGQEKRAAFYQKQYQAFKLSS